MIIKKSFWTKLILLISFTMPVFAQPYYYHNKGNDSTIQIWQFNLQSGVDNLFYSDYGYFNGDITWDPTQSWLFLFGDVGDRDYPIFVIDVLNTHQIQAPLHRFPEQDTSQKIGRVQFFHNQLIEQDSSQKIGKVQSFSRFNHLARNGKSIIDGIVFNLVKNVFYVTWSTDFLRSDYSSSWSNIFKFQKTAIYDASIFKLVDSLPVLPAWITSISSVSDDGDYLYMENRNNQKAQAIGKYSLLAKQLIINKKLSDIYVPGGYKDVDDSKKGKFLLQFLYPSMNLADKKFAVYDIDRDTTYAIIPFPPVANGSISSDGKYVIIEETPVNPDHETESDRYYHPGRIDIFDGKSGKLIQKLQLPPDGKVLVFDNYPNMLYYYLPNEQRSINIDLSKLAPPTGCAVKLINSVDNTLTTGSLQYYEGAWKDAVNNNDGTFTVNTTQKTVSLRMTYEYVTQTKSNVTVGTDTIVFQTMNAQIKLQNSKGILIDTGSVQYYAGAWRNLGTTTNGITTKELLPSNYSFRVTYAYASTDKQQDIGVDPVVVFQTVNANMQLKNSQGTLIDTAIVQYYSGAWRDFGITSGGIATKELLPNNYSFKMTYAFASKDKQQDLSTNPIVVFQTVNANVQLQNSLGNLIPAPSGDQGTVQYYSGAWRDFGITSNGVATKELLPNNYSFRMTYAFASNDKQQDLSANPMVVFNTVNAAVQLQNSQGALIDTGAVQYYSGAWRDLGVTSGGIATKELLPNNYSFRMSYAYASKDLQQNIGTNATVVFKTVNATVQLLNSLGNPIDQGTVQYYSGAWRSFGITANGIATKELLPNNYSFRMTNEYISLDKAQDISTNNIVNYSTVLCTIKVNDSQNQPVNNALASYYSGSWRQIGTTVNGIVTKELLPVNLSFRIKSGTTQLDKSQNLLTNNVVEFVLQP